VNLEVLARQGFGELSSPEIASALTVPLLRLGQVEGRMTPDLLPFDKNEPCASARRIGHGHVLRPLQIREPDGQNDSA
jgi:hypothetical protein